MKEEDTYSVFSSNIFTRTKGERWGKIDKNRETRVSAGEKMTGEREWTGESGLEG